MTKEELMIGDWVLVLGIPMRIAELGTVMAVFLDENEEESYNSYAIIEPVPITKEIVEKNGFSRHPDYDYSDEVYRLFVGEEDDGDDYLKFYSIEICPKNSRIRIHRYIYPIPDTEFMGTIRYVHELQHALRLCGIEKEIEIY